MARVLYHTGSALLDFDRQEVMEKISSFKEEHGVERAAHLEALVVSNTDGTMIVPPEMTNFCVLALELLGDGMG